mgnify:FL=1
MAKKYITPELIEKLLNKTEYNEEDSHDEDHIKKVVLDYYHAEITDEWNTSADFHIYEETTADGYSVYVCAHDDRNINVAENVHYYDGELSQELKQAIVDGCVIYVDGMEAYFIDEAIRELYITLAERKEEEITDDLLDKGYENRED